MWTILALSLFIYIENIYLVNILNRKVHVVVSMSPLPESMVKSFFTTYADEFTEDVEVIGVYGKSRDEIFEALKKAEIIIGDYTFNMKIDAEMCKVMKNVKLIQQPSTGYDHIDVKACSEMGIPVANAGGANAVSVAEYTIAAALVLLKRLIQAHERMNAGEWPQWELMNAGTFDLSEKTWGIIGLGRIGKEVAKRLTVFNTRVLYYDKVRPSEAIEKELRLEYRPLARLLRESDIVSIHLPLTDETRKLISEKELRMMKPGAILINPSRGEIVDEVALAKALEENWLGGVAVDVYSREPPTLDHPLLKLKGVNVLLTPHIAGANTDSRRRIIEFSVKNVIRVLKGDKPLAVVNM
ncbi:MAG: 2-hydroxyacid dehydrogenase [Thermoprotei archaeon]|jgi:glyoxylate reductase